MNNSLITNQPNRGQNRLVGIETQIRLDRLQCLRLQVCLFIANLVDFLRISRCTTGFIFIANTYELTTNTIQKYNLNIEFLHLTAIQQSSMGIPIPGILHISKIHQSNPFHNILIFHPVQHLFKKFNFNQRSALCFRSSGCQQCVHFQYGYYNKAVCCKLVTVGEP